MLRGRDTRVEWTVVFRVDDMATSSLEGHLRSNITQQSSKGSLFTNFEDVEVSYSPALHLATDQTISVHQSFDILCKYNSMIAGLAVAEWHG